MKNIGRLLSKFSLVHYVVVVIFLCGITAALLLFTRKEESIYIDLTSYPQEGWLDPFPPPFTETDSLRIGDAAHNWKGDKTVEITNIEKSEWGGNRKSILVTIKLLAVYDPRTHQYTYNDIPIIVGNKFPLNTQKTMFNGQIINVYRSPAERYSTFTQREADVVVSIRLLEPWQAESLRYFEAKNSLGNIIAKTTDIEISPAEVDVPTDKGIIYKGFSTIRKDVLMTLHIKNVYCSDQTCYFNGVLPLKIGLFFWAQSNTAVIDNGKIVEFTLR